MTCWTSFVPKTWEDCISKAHKGDTSIFFLNHFLINIFRELRSTFFFLGCLNCNKILREIQASVTTNTLLEFNFLLSTQLTTETHL